MDVKSKIIMLTGTEYKSSIKNSAGSLIEASIRG